MSIHPKVELWPYTTHITAVPSTKKYEPWKPSPPSLVELSGNALNKIPMPVCWKWTADDVTKWLYEQIGLPQYKECFLDNCINGRRLLLIDASKCVKIGIHDFKHIMLITNGIRKLFSTPALFCDQNYRPFPECLWIEYLKHKVYTGPKYENITAIKFFEKMGVIDAQKCCLLRHWGMIKPDYPDFEYHRYGLAPRKSIYRRIENNRQPRDHTFYKRSCFKPNYFIRIDK